MDDVLVFGANSKEHNKRLKAVLEQLEAAGVTINASKCAFNKDLVKFLCHIVDKEGILADPDPGIQADPDPRIQADPDPDGSFKHEATP